MSRPRTKVFKGIDASPGICVGLVHLVDRRKFRVPKTHVARENIDLEKDRFRRAVDMSVSQLSAIKEKMARRDRLDPTAIIEAHLLMMKDEMLVAGTEKLIAARGINAEWALKDKVAEIRQVFDRLEDDYFRERRSDVEFVGQRILRNLMGHEAEVRPPAHERAVVVAHDLSPVDTAGLSRQKVTGFVTEVGGKTSHTAIIARSLELPAIVGVEGILEKVGTGDRIIVDGYRGEVILHPSERAVQEALVRSQGLRSRMAELVMEKALPAETLDGYGVRLSSNLEMVEEVETALRYGADGIGLYRTEFLFLDRRPPSEGFQRRSYQKILRQMKGRPVTIRTLDPGGDKKLPFLRTEPEANPAMGLRSIRACLQNRPLFLTQLRALLRASVDGRLKIMFPMISVLHEIREAKALLREAQDQLRAKGQAFSDDIEVGMMIEVPSAAFMSDLFATEVDFFSIGTNDLIQYTLAVDRQNEQVAYLFNPLHVSILRMLGQVVTNAHQAGIKVAMCGEMAGNPLYLHILLGLGLDEISMNPLALPYARHLIRGSHLKDARRLYRQVIKLRDSGMILRMVQDWMAERFPEFFTSEGNADILGGL